jgi:DNA/RNA-binding domain of Phe-tRNA-synthetase-like protein
MLELNMHVPMQVAAVEVEGVHVTRDRTAFERFQECAAAYRSKYGEHESGPLKAVEGLDVARDLFHALGMDPTKTRPASEALLRRALKGQSLFCINTLVDAVNWCSLDFLLPICVYDRDRISAPVIARPGEPDETYQSLTGKEVQLRGRYVLVDATGPFGNPITDSLRTAISEDTTRALAVVFTPTDFDSGNLEALAQTTANRIIEFCGGQVAGIGLHRPGC